MTRSISALVVAGLWAAAGGAWAQEPPPATPPEKAPGAPDAIDIQSVLEDSDDVLQSDMANAPEGDNKLFTVVTDNDVSALSEGDIYKSNRSYFKVVGIDEQGAKGGEFDVQRIKGTDDPGRVWNRVSGFGPLTFESQEKLLDRILSGGPLMYPIAFLLLVTIVIALNSLRVFRRGRQIPRWFLNESKAAIAAGDVQRFEDMALREKGLFGHLCQAMAKGFQHSTIQDIRERCETMLGKQVALLRTPLRTLSFVAAVAPLLGLLGTVVGIIICFESLEGQAASAAKAQAMAKGIKIALLTTAAGLSVAVPTLLVYFIFNTRLNLLVAECESAADDCIHDLMLLKRRAEDAATVSAAPAGEAGP